VGLREVIESKGLFCALYSDRGSHFFVTPKAGEKVDKNRLTQVGRAMKELGVQMIPAYSPQARGRSERNFGTWQGRLPQELRLAGITTQEGANEFLREHYRGVFNDKFTVEAREPGTAFRRASRSDLVLDLHAADRARGGQGQHRGHRGSELAVGEEQVPRLAGRMHGDDPRTSQRKRVHPVWSPHSGPLPGERRDSCRGHKETAGEPWKRRGGGDRGKPQTGFPRSPPPLGNPATAAGFPLSHRSGGYSPLPNGDTNKEPQAPFGKPKRACGSNY